jgi:hypothetical protein
MFVAWGARRTWERAVVLIGGAVVAALVCWPLALDPRPNDPQIRAAVGLITRMWQPAGHDDASQLARTLRGEEDAEGYRRLAALYDAEGRDAEARMARARADALDRRAQL